MDQSHSMKLICHVVGPGTIVHYHGMEVCNMWSYEKRLQFPVNIKKPDPKAAQIIISQYGGPYIYRGNVFKNIFWNRGFSDIIQKIEKDDNTISYVKIIHEFDLEGNDWMYDEEMTEFEWHMKYYNFLKKLENAGAKLQILLNDF